MLLLVTVTERVKDHQVPSVQSQCEISQTRQIIISKSPVVVSREATHFSGYKYKYSPISSYSVTIFVYETARCMTTINLINIMTWNLCQSCKSQPVIMSKYHRVTLIAPLTFLMYLLILSINFIFVQCCSSNFSNMEPEH